MGTKTVLTGDGVFEDNLLKWHKGEGHIGAKEDEGADDREISCPIGKGWLINNAKKGKLSKDDSDSKNADINWENRVFSDATVGIIDEWDEKGEDE